jgi:hypothetical protein
MEREGDDLGEKRPDRFLAERAHLGTTIAKRCNDIAGVCKLIDRDVDAVRGKLEVVGQAPPRDPGDEFAAAGLHGRQA